MKDREEWLNQPPLFGCAGCYDIVSREADDLRVFEGKTWCHDCWDDSDYREQSDWHDLPPFVPLAEARVRELEEALRDLGQLLRDADLLGYAEECDAALARKEG